MPFVCCKKQKSLQNKNTKAEAKKQLIHESQTRISAFQKELVQKEREAQRMIEEKVATEFEQSKQPLVAKQKRKLRHCARFQLS